MPQAAPTYSVEVDRCGRGWRVLCSDRDKVETVDRWLDVYARGAAERMNPKNLSESSHGRLGRGVNGLGAEQELGTRGQWRGIRQHGLGVEVEVVEGLVRSDCANAGVVDPQE